MAELKTMATKTSVSQFLSSIADKQRRADCKTVAKMMRASTGKPAKMWGTGMVGFGSYDYKYASGREGTWFECGFSPRAQNLTIYIMPGFSKYGALMKKLGNYKTGKSCLYVKKLDNIDLDVLQSLIDKSVGQMRDTYKS